MRILYDSRNIQFKTPFGTIRRGQNCVIRIHVPFSSGATAVSLILEDQDQQVVRVIPLSMPERNGDYGIWECSFHMEKSGLYFYWFSFTKEQGGFRLFKQGNGTNMEAGGKWQLSVIPEDFTTPSYAAGAVMYQIMPDRFYRAGQCDLTEKLQPFTVHKNWNELPEYLPDKDGNWCGDFFGGNLAGIREKLPYLQSLGVNILYLNPIFMAYSNHRYDTADYKRIDPMLGTEEDFRLLCEDAHSRNMRVILDGVFSHTGSNSVYFDSKGIFGHGAVSDPESPYRSWYRFSNYPEKYEAWWGMPTLPNIEELDPGYMDYIIDGEDSVAAYWLKLGADGFRLDVVDELPDKFVLRLKQRLRQLKPDAMLLGEVWEDASNKRSYGEARHYFTDGELDSVMNYPWRKAIIDFVLGRDDGSAFGESVMALAENYPPQVLNCLMNLLSSHDTVRIFTALAEEYPDTRAARSTHRMSAEVRARALHKLHLAVFLQFMLPGMASIFYGDEAGLEGFEDPFCRKTYPWDGEDIDLLNYYRCLCRLKNELSVLKDGVVRVTEAGQGSIFFTRENEKQVALICVNATNKPRRLPDGYTIRFGRCMDFDGSSYWLEPGGFCLLILDK